jgi:hypothetical protein
MALVAAVAAVVDPLGGGDSLSSGSSSPPSDAASPSPDSSSPSMHAAVRACFLNDDDFTEIAGKWMPRLTDVWKTVEKKEGKATLTISDAELRFEYFLVCAAASIVRGFATKRVAFLSPTAYYMMQAQRFGGSLMHQGDKAGASPRLRYHLAAQFAAWAETDVVCMHGGLFFSPPADWPGVCIVQDMPQEDVPWTRPFASRCCGE